MEAFLVPSPQAEVLDSHLFCLSLVLNSFLGLCFGKKRKVALTVSKSTVMCLRLLYADDLLNAKENEARAIRRCFEQYFSWSGQEANIEKSCILFSKNTSKLDRMAIKVVFGFKEMAKDSVYFGNTLLLSRNKMKDFKIMKDRIGQRIEGWNQNLLSKDGKATFIFSIIQNIPTYTMSTFRIPNGLCNDLDAMVHRFWWGHKKGSNRFLALKVWKDLWRPKKE